MTEERLDTLLQEHFAPLRMARPPAPRRWRPLLLGAGGLACTAAALLLLTPRPLSAQEVLDLGDARLRDVPYVEIRTQYGAHKPGRPDIIADGRWLIRGELGGGLRSRPPHLVLRDKDGEWIYNQYDDYLVRALGFRSLDDSQLFSRLVLTKYIGGPWTGVVAQKTLPGYAPGFRPRGGVTVERDEAGRELRVITLVSDPWGANDTTVIEAKAAFFSDGRPAWVATGERSRLDDTSPAWGRISRVDFTYPKAPRRVFSEIPNRAPDIEAAQFAPASIEDQSEPPCSAEWAMEGAVVLKCGPKRSKIDGLRTAPYSNAPPFPNGGKPFSLVISDDQGRLWRADNLAAFSREEFPWVFALWPVEPELTEAVTFFGEPPHGRQDSALTPPILQALFVRKNAPEEWLWMNRSLTAAMAGRPAEARKAGERALAAQKSKLGTDAPVRNELRQKGILPLE